MAPPVSTLLHGMARHGGHAAQGDARRRRAALQMDGKVDVGLLGAPVGKGRMIAARGVEVGKIELHPALGLALTVTTLGAQLKEMRQHQAGDANVPDG